MAFDERSGSHGISRRSLFRRTGATAAAAAASVVAVDVSHGQEAPHRDPVTTPFDTDLTLDEFVEGDVVRVELPATVWVDRQDGTPPVAVDVEAGAPVVKDGPAETGRLAAGDEIVAQGVWRGDRFVARVVSPLFRVVEGDIISRNGDEIETSAGRVRLNPRTTSRSGEATGRPIRARNPADLRRGDRLYAFGRVEPGSGVLVAAEVATR